MRESECFNGSLISRGRKAGRNLSAALLVSLASYVSAAPVVVTPGLLERSEHELERGSVAHVVHAFRVHRVSSPLTIALGAFSILVVE